MVQIRSDHLKNSRDGSMILILERMASPSFWVETSCQSVCLALFERPLFDNQPHPSVKELGVSGSARPQLWPGDHSHHSYRAEAGDGLHRT